MPVSRCVFTTDYDSKRFRSNEQAFGSHNPHVPTNFDLNSLCFTILKHSQLSAPKKVNAHIASHSLHVIPLHSSRDCGCLKLLAVGIMPVSPCVFVFLDTYNIVYISSHHILSREFYNILEEILGIESCFNLSVSAFLQYLKFIILRGRDSPI